MMHPRTVGLLCLAVTSLGWGLNWPTMKLLLQQWPPLFARGTSGLCAALIVGLVAARAGQSLAVPAGLLGRVGAAAFFNVFAWMGPTTLSLRWLDVGQAALIVYTMPAWTTLLAWPLRGMRPTLASVAGLALCSAGVALLFVGAGSAIRVDQLPGVVLALGGAVLFAVGTLVSKPLPMPPLAVVAWQLALGCAPMLAYGLLVEHPDLSALTRSGAAAMAYMTLVPMALCYITWFAALRRVPPALASIGTLLTPVIGVVSAAWAFGEPLGMRQLAAMALTLAGVALALRSRDAADADRPAREQAAAGPDAQRSAPK